MAWLLWLTAWWRRRPMPPTPIPAQRPGDTHSRKVEPVEGVVWPHFERAEDVFAWAGYHHEVEEEA